MLKVDRETLASLDRKHPGFLKRVLQLERAGYPGCPACQSQDTATIHVGIVWLTVNLAAATSRFKLLANSRKSETYYCNACGRDFGTTQNVDDLLP
jgi:hypothetical protein